MAGTASKVRIGAAWVTFGGVDLGYTKGGISFTMETVTVPIVIEKIGPNPVVEPIIGRRLSVRTQLAESSYSRLASLIPGSGGTSIDDGQGTNLLASAGTLTIAAIANSNDKIVLYGMVPTGSTGSSFMFNNERVWPVEFKGTINSGTVVQLYEIS